MMGRIHDRAGELLVQAGVPSARTDRVSDAVKSQAVRVADSESHLDRQAGLVADIAVQLQGKLVTGMVINPLGELQQNGPMLDTLTAELCSAFEALKTMVVEELERWDDRMPRASMEVDYIRVPGRTAMYLIVLIGGEIDRCSCPGHMNHGHCRHVTARIGSRAVGVTKCAACVAFLDYDEIVGQAEPRVCGHCAHSG